jgi:membrane-associated protease RseP (regulator of RpoE activity)
MNSLDLTVLVFGLAVRPATTALSAGRLGVPTRRFFFLGPAPVLRRIAAILAGTVATWLFAWLLAFAYLAVHEESQNRLIVDEAVAGTPAHGRLRTGDEVVEVDGQHVADIEDLRARVEEAFDRPLRLAVNRNGHREIVEVVPAQGRLGVKTRQLTRRASIPAAAVQAVAHSVRAGWRYVKQVSAPRIQTLMGPVAVVRGGGTAPWLLVDRKLGEWASQASLAFLILLPLDALRLLWAIARPEARA